MLREIQLYLFCAVIDYLFAIDTGQVPIPPDMKNNLNIYFSYVTVSVNLKSENTLI